LWENIEGWRCIVKVDGGSPATLINGRAWVFNVIRFDPNDIDHKCDGVGILKCFATQPHLVVNRVAIVTNIVQHDRRQRINSSPAISRSANMPSLLSWTATPALPVIPVLTTVQAAIAILVMMTVKVIEKVFYGDIAKGRYMLN
jgi:hypothetical protein